MQQIVDDMEAAWESRSYPECNKMHRTAAERTVTGGSQDVPALSKNLLRHYYKQPGHYKRNCPNLKSKLGMINFESESEEDKALRRIGTINGRPCKCLINTGANQTTVPVHLIQPNKFTGVEEKSCASN